MATEILKTSDHTITRFWGGNRGVCLQITARNCGIHNSVIEQLQEEGFIQLDIEEVKKLKKSLDAFLQEYDA